MTNLPTLWITWRFARVWSFKKFAARYNDSSHSTVTLYAKLCLIGQCTMTTTMIVRDRRRGRSVSWLSESVGTRLRGIGWRVHQPLLRAAVQTMHLFLLKHNVRRRQLTNGRFKVQRAVLLMQKEPPQVPVKWNIVTIIQCCSWLWQ